MKEGEGDGEIWIKKKEDEISEKMGEGYSDKKKEKEKRGLQKDVKKKRL